MKYNPLVAPDPVMWLSTDEAERLNAVLKFHKRSKAPIPNIQLHGNIHVVIENQIAMGSKTPVSEALQRLLDDGLDRHDAVHALGSVLATHIYELLGGNKTTSTEIKSDYFDEIRSLTAQKWLDEYGDPDH